MKITQTILVSGLAFTALIALSGCGKSVDAMCNEIVDAQMGAITSSTSLLTGKSDNASLNDMMADAKSSALKSCLAAPKQQVEAQYNAVQSLK